MTPHLVCITCGYTAPRDERERAMGPTAACPECDGFMERENA